MKKHFCFKCNILITKKNFDNGEWGVELIGLTALFKCEKCTNKDMKRLQSIDKVIPS